MKRFKTKVVFLTAAAFFALGLILWPGCATPPLPASRKPVSSLKQSDFAFTKEAHPTRDEVTAKLGQPDEYFPDLRVACYKLNEVKRRRLVLLFFVLPVAAPRDPDRLEFAMIRFDEHDRAQGTQLQTVYMYDARRELRWAAERWRITTQRLP